MISINCCGQPLITLSQFNLKRNKEKKKQKDKEKDKKDGEENIQVVDWYVSCEDYEYPWTYMYYILLVAQFCEYSLMNDEPPICGLLFDDHATYFIWICYSAFVLK